MRSLISSQGWQQAAANSFPEPESISRRERTPGTRETRENPEDFSGREERGERGGIWDFVWFLLLGNS